MSFRRNTPRVELEPCQFRYRFSGNSTLGNHDIQRFDRDIEQSLVVYLGADSAPTFHMRFLPGEDRDHIVLVNDRGRPSFDDLAAVADPRDEDPGILGQRFEFGDGLVHQI